MITRLGSDAIFANLSSGSSGNCTYIGDGTTGVLVDCGLSTKQVSLRMAAIGLENAPIDGVLVTHEHGDHVNAAAIFQRAHKRKTGLTLPFFMTQGTAIDLNPKVRPENITHISSGSHFSLGKLLIEPTALSHDTVEPVFFVITANGARIGVITDLGKITHLVRQKFSTLDLALIEFNHDVEMLMDSSRPWATKQRIRGKEGHLSNAQAAALIEEVSPNAPQLRQLILGHLSGECNTPETAEGACFEALDKANRTDIIVSTAHQKNPTGPIAICL